MLLASRYSTPRLYTSAPSLAVFPVMVLEFSTVTVPLDAAAVAKAPGVVGVDGGVAGHSAAAERQRAGVEDATAESTPRHGFWWAHVFWWMPRNPSLGELPQYRRYVTDLAKDPVQCFLHRWHWALPLALAGVLYGLGEAWDGVGLSWVVWGIFVRTAVLYHATWLVNSATHLWGYRNFPTRDHSTNLWWVALVSLGEGWHNNHHAFPRSARHGLRWWEVDATYCLLRLLALVGLARRIQVPSKAVRRSAAATVRSIEEAGEFVPS
jgi:fatty-acid desaturase